MSPAEHDAPVVTRAQVWLFAVGVVAWLAGVTVAVAGMGWFLSELVFAAGWLISAAGLTLAMLSLLFGVVRADPAKLLRPSAWAAAFRRAGLPWTVFAAVAGALFALFATLFFIMVGTAFVP